MARQITSGEYWREFDLRPKTDNLVNLQFLESFAKKHISSSEDRLEETKRRKLSLKAQKLVELMMVSGIPTSSGYEERIRFSEMEVVESGAIEHGMLSTQPEGNFINGWDVNVAGVGTTAVKRNIRYHKHAVSQILRTTRLIYADNCSRNFSLESRGRMKQRSGLVVDMETFQSCTRNFVQSSQEKSFLRCRRRTSRAQRLRI